MERKHTIPEFNVAFSRSETPLYYADLLDTQLFLVSEQVKNVFDMYDKKIEYKVFCILNNRLGQYHYYFAPILQEIECLLPDSYSKVNQNHIEKIIMDRKKIGDACVFKISNRERELVAVRMDIMESLLRREIYSIDYEKVCIK